MYFHEEECILNVIFTFNNTLPNNNYFPDIVNVTFIHEVTFERCNWYHTVNFNNRINIYLWTMGYYITLYFIQFRNQVFRY
jgi:hypothetical protein